MPQTLNRLWRYFDLQSHRRGEARGYAAGTSLSVFPQYVALVLGIAVQPFLAEFQTTGHWNVDWRRGMAWLVAALVTGLIVFPGVYRKAFDADQPKFVQWCAIFATGIGWKSLLTAAVKTALPG